MRFVRRRPYQPKEIVGFLTPFEHPLVEKMTDSRTDNKLKSHVFEDRLIARLAQEQPVKLLVGLENDDSRGRLHPLPKNLRAIAQAPAKVKNDVGFFDRVLTIEFL